MNEIRYMEHKNTCNFHFFLKIVFDPYLRARRVGSENRSPSSADSTLDFLKIPQKTVSLTAYFELLVGLIGFAHAKK